MVLKDISRIVETKKIELFCIKTSASNTGIWKKCNSSLLSIDSWGEEVNGVKEKQKVL